MNPARHVRFLLRPAILLTLASCTFISDADVNAKFATDDTDADMDGVQASIDCDDTDPEVGAGDPWYLDVDGDSYGDLASPSAASVCPGTSGPEGYVPDSSDCDDHDAEIHPSAAEVWYDGVDQDCNANDCDQDADGYCVTDYAFAVPEGVQAADCNDIEAGVSPGATEVWYDGVDQDCDANDCDQDTDGYCVGDYAFAIPDGAQAGDCDDADPAWNPGADESDCTDPNDYNCDGSTGFADEDGDGVPACEECDDTSAASYPGALEVCDGVDNDCDGTTDVGASDEATWYADLDGDGYGDPITAVVSCTKPGGNVTDSTDCDDTQASFHPGADELDCTDPNDYNCDGSVGYDDADGDGSAACLDCDDANSAAFPGGIEVCDGADNDCDGAVDLGASDAPTWYADSDADSFGDPTTAAESCTAPEGYVTDDMDCDDVDDAVNPNAVEICDGIDNDCDTTVDVNALDPSDWYADSDGDGFGDPGVSESACDPPVDYVADSTDCDDGAATVYPGAPEVCDDLDNACNGGADDLTGLWYADSDDDGFGDPDTVSNACAAPVGYVADDTDCDDVDVSSFPGGVEVCDGVDNDCDGAADNNAVDAPTWFLDADLDGYGDPSDTESSCVAEPGYIAEDRDCDDTDAGVNPGRTETCATAADDDCDGLADEQDAPGCVVYYYDGDGDSFGDPAVGRCGCAAYSAYSTTDAGDCDDTSAGVNPTVTEVYYDGVDADCSGGSDDDADGDGSDSDAFGGTDCDDANAAIFAGASEVCGDGVDDDCDGGDAACSLAGADAQYTGETAADYAGFSVSTAGDVDGDGFGDLLIGAQGNADGGSRAGAAYLVLGSDTPGDVELGTADAQYTGEAGDLAGYSVSTAGDVDGDGFGDILIGAIWNNNGGSGAGAAYLVLGSATPASLGLGTADAQYTGETAADYAGLSVSSAGDVDGDGFGDILIGAPDNGDGGSYAGAAYLVLGSSAPASLSLGAANAQYTGEAASDDAGYSVSTAADVDGDGLGDMLIGAPNNFDGVSYAGAAYLVLGRASLVDLPLEFADAKYTGEGTNDRAGDSVSTAGDVDGDGFGDLLIGAPNNGDGGSYAGAAYLVLGSATPASLRLGTENAQYTGEATSDRAGDSVSTAGDVDGDGFGDLLVGAYNNGDGGSYAGAAYLVLGSATPSSLSLGTADGQYTGEGSNDSAGCSVSTAGDVDGDGFGDLLIGAYGNADGGSYAGAGYLILGSGL